MLVAFFGAGLPVYFSVIRRFAVADMVLALIKMGVAIDPVQGPLRIVLCFAETDKPRLLAGPFAAEQNPISSTRATVLRAAHSAGLLLEALFIVVLRKWRDSFAALRDSIGWPRPARDRQEGARPGRHRAVSSGHSFAASCCQQGAADGDYGGLGTMPGPSAFRGQEGASVAGSSDEGCIPAGRRPRRRGTRSGLRLLAHLSKSAVRGCRAPPGTVTGCGSLPADRSRKPRRARQAEVGPGVRLAQQHRLRRRRLRRAVGSLQGQRASRHLVSNQVGCHPGKRERPRAAMLRQPLAQRMRKM